MSLPGPIAMLLNELLHPPMPPFINTCDPGGCADPNLHGLGFAQKGDDYPGSDYKIVLMRQIERLPNE